MKIVTATEMREIDRVTSERFGVPSLTLMENAGAAVAEFALAAYPDAKGFGVICGRGNNGGDGFVAARKLREAGRNVRTLLLGDPKELKEDAAENFRRLGSPGSDGAFECDVLIDAILGTGFRPPVSGAYARGIAKMNALQAPVLAVDIPSGADADVMGDQTGAVARADAIVTFTAPRPAHVFGNLTPGPTVIASIGSPKEAIQSSLRLDLITAKDI